MSQFCPLFSDVDHSDESEKDTQTSTSCNSKKENFHSLEQAEIYLVKTVRECELHITKSFQFEKWDSICDTFDCELFFNTDNTDIRGSKLRVIFLNMLIAEQASSRRNRHLSYFLNEIMADMSVLLPFNFKFLRNPEAPSWSSVNIAGSSQIQHYKFDVDDEQVLVQLQRGVAIEETGLDLELLEILTAVYCQGVRVIYNLVPQYASTRSKDLLKWLWENQFANAEYIVEVDNISICIEVLAYFLSFRVCFDIVTYSGYDGPDDRYIGEDMQTHKKQCPARERHLGTLQLRMWSVNHVS